jgi:hypothetical protein
MESSTIPLFLKTKIYKVTVAFSGKTSIPICVKVQQIKGVYAQIRPCFLLQQKKNTALEASKVKVIVMLDIICYCFPFRILQVHLLFVWT